MIFVRTPITYWVNEKGLGTGTITVQITVTINMIHILDIWKHTMAAVIYWKEVNVSIILVLPVPVPTYSGLEKLNSASKETVL